MSWFAPKLRQTATASATRTILNTASIAAMCAVAFLLSVGQGDTADPTVSPDVEIQGKSFRCIRKMTPVRHFYVDNLLGDLAATVAVANSATGGVYPPGSVIQLIPGEAMVKRDNGFNAATRDWEFFELDVSTNGTKIRKRGFADVVNRFGGNCFACHIAARLSGIWSARGTTGALPSLSPAG